MRIQHNIPAMSSYRNYTNNVSALSKNLEKLSSGYKINRAGDDAAGLAISEKMRAQITGLEAAGKNVKDGISLVKTAEGAMQEIHDMLNRMSYLATQSANGTYDNETDRAALQQEVDALKDEINRISKAANFNGIKLLDGSLGEKGGLAVDDKVDEIEANFAAGIEISNTNPGGTKGKYTIGLNGTFGSGSKLTIAFGTGDPENKPVDQTITSTATGGHDGTTNTGVTGAIDPATANAGSITLEYGVDFFGTTAAEQAQSIAECLEDKFSDIAENFDITWTEDGQVILENKNEGNKEITVTAVDVEDTDNVEVTLASGASNSAFVGAAVGTAGGASGTASKFMVEDIFSATKGFEFANGDKLTLSFTDLAGNTWEASIEVDLGDSSGAATVGTHQKILAALKDATFNNVDGTLGDESTIKLSELFDITIENASVGGEVGATLKLAGIANKGTEIFNGTKVTATVSRGEDAVAVKTGTGATQIQSAADASSGTGTAASYKTGLDTSVEGNFSVGDKITIKGKLSDGKLFSVTLEAGKDFKLYDDALTGYDQTLAEIRNVLMGTRGWEDVEVNIYDADDADMATVVDTVRSSELFGDDKEIKVTIDDLGTPSNNGLFFTSNVKGQALNSYVTGVTIEAAKTVGLTKDLVNGNQQTGAGTIITFADGQVAEGSSVTVAGKTYVFGEGEEKPEGMAEGNVYVQVDDLTSGAAIAKALAEAVKENTEHYGEEDEDGNKLYDYTVSVNDNQVVLTSSEVGSTAKAIEVETAGGGSKSGWEFTLDPASVTNGSRVKINGQEYEFVAADHRATIDDETGESKYNVVVVPNLNVKEGDGAVTAKQLADALKAAIEANPNKGDVDVMVDDNGKVTVTGSAFTQKEDGHFEWNTLEEPGFYRKGGLKLQIGDTAEAFNQMNVVIDAVNTRALGINDLSIADQDSAAEAIDKIKGAINYVSTVRGGLGAAQNRLEHTQNNLSVMAENIQDAESTIRDTDVAEEMMSYVKNNILVQSAQAMLAQANQLPQGVLQLLG